MTTASIGASSGGLAHLGSTFPYAEANLTVAGLMAAAEASIFPLFSALNEEVAVFWQGRLLGSVVLVAKSGLRHGVRSVEDVVAHTQWELCAGALPVPVPTFTLSHGD